MELNRKKQNDNFPGKDLLENEEDKLIVPEISEESEIFDPPEGCGGESGYLHQTLGNTPGNIINYGLVALSDSWLYYSDLYEDGNLYKIRIDGTDRELLLEGVHISVSVAGGYVYFIKVTEENGNAENKIYRISINGGTAEKLSDDECGDFLVADGYIYYCCMDGGGSVKKMRADGSREEKLADGMAYCINFYNNWVYYQEGAKNCLRKVRADGSELRQLCDDDCRATNVAGGYIYYSNAGDDGKIYRRDANGENPVVICEDMGRWLNVNAGWIYYANMLDDYKLYKIRTDGSGRQKIYDFSVCWINVAGDWIYFRQYFDENYGYGDEEESFMAYKIRTDGSDFDILY